MVVFVYLPVAGLKSKKKLSPYNKFMKTELAKVKKNNPGLPHKDAFKKAAQNWATSAENPKGPNAANK
ncbi:hypothetical protein BX070DRAFT_191636 [Coemansia spiralis]|nr:hypothetical protein BX070DRAFT_191636 [Coemansia spiralis]